MRASSKFGAAAVLFGAVACGASAQSSVSVVGLVDSYAGRMKNSGDPASRTVVGSGGMTTSFFGFTATEDLGGGLKAEMNLGGFLLMDSGASGRFGGDNLFSRDANVALAGRLGRVMIGRASAPNLLPSALSNPFGSSFTFSPLVVHANVPSGPFGARTWIASNAGDTGWSNQVVYSTPDFNGLKVNLHYQAGEVSNDSSNRNVGVNAFYITGPLTLTAFYHDVQVANPNPGALIDATAAPVRYNTISRQKTAFVGGNYDFQVLKAYASYQENSNDTSIALDMEDKLFSAGLRVPVGAGAIMLGHARTKRTGTLVGAELERDTTSVGYDYFLSKRTDVYAVIMNDKITASSRANSYGAGIRHTF